jgi:hypothetical protein
VIGTASAASTTTLPTADEINVSLSHRDATGKTDALPAQLRPFALGEVIVTPLGRRAIVKAFRKDGFIDAQYVDEPRTTGEVILNPDLVRRIED